MAHNEPMKHAPCVLLLPEAESFDQTTIAIFVSTLEIFEVALALANQHEQTPATMMVLFVGFEMAGKPVDALGQERYLHFR